MSVSSDRFIFLLFWCQQFAQLQNKVKLTTRVAANCAKSLQGEAPCGSAVYGKVDEMSPAPLPDPSPRTPPPSCGRHGGQGEIGDITSKGLRTAVALSTAAYFLAVLVPEAVTQLQNKVRLPNGKPPAGDTRKREH